ncbi:hypothetical protein [Nonomuraea typhae]|uniref:hypothetical protein n=1 Tax=Nonomuraea typhae TaxID=2603600 RepID=UPI0012F902F8|nr:hypothetical protein [Nonomuraea typhae]
MTVTQKFKSPIMQQFQEEMLAKGRAEGEVRGEAKAVVRVLRNRGIEVPDDAESRILSCTDIEQIDSWLTGVATVSHVDELFG